VLFEAEFSEWLVEVIGSAYAIADRSNLCCDKDLQPIACALHLNRAKHGQIGKPRDWPRMWELFILR